MSSSRKPVVCLVSAGLIGVSLAACSSSGGDSVSAQQAATDVATALCARIEACAPLYMQLAYGDASTCTTRTSQLFTQTLGAPGTGWTPSLGEACAKAIPGASCDDALDHDLPSACHAPAGQAANGAPCGDSGQCASSYCNLGTNGKCGTCAAAVAQAGGACYRDDDCAFGTRCVGQNANGASPTAGKCTALGAAGAACSATAPCHASLNCIAGTCTTPLSTGAACDQRPDVFGNCSELRGEYCSAKTGGTCAMLGVAGVGKPCGLVGTTLEVCSAGGTCVVPTGAAMGSCVAPAADFGTCVSSNGPGCLAPASCTQGVCQVPEPASCR